MAYTRPDATAADARFTGDAYTRPAFDVADATWYVAPAGSHCELRGDVYQDGALVSRKVRAHRHDTGDVIGETISYGGHFVITLDGADWVDVMCYVVPLDTASDAQDWSPPVANRVYPVLVTA